MSKCSWTPGPWGVVSRFTGPLVIVGNVSTDVDRSGKMDIAHVGAETFSVAMANAELIAAAPAMAEALEQLLDDMGDDGLCVCPAAKQQAIAALALARGEDPK